MSGLQKQRAEEEAINRQLPAWEKRNIPDVLVRAMDSAYALPEPLDCTTIGAEVAALTAVLGEGGWSQDPARLAPKLLEWRDRWQGETPAALSSLSAIRSPAVRSTPRGRIAAGMCASPGVQ